MLPRPRPGIVPVPVFLRAYLPRWLRRLVFQMGCMASGDSLHNTCIHTVQKGGSAAVSQIVSTVKTDLLWASQFLNTQTKVQAEPKEGTNRHRSTAEETESAAAARRQAGRSSWRRTEDRFVSPGLAPCGPRLPPEMASRNNEPKRAGGHRHHGHADSC